jgi:YggT family protein
MPLALLIQVTRITVITCFAAACLIALASWALRGRRLNPFGTPARMLRRLSDPIMRPLERRVIQAGGNPQDAPLWLVGISVVGGLLLLSLVGWLGEAIVGLIGSFRAGPAEVGRFLVAGVFSLLMAALLVRVIASWLGVSLYGRWMRPIAALTGWIVEPIQRVLPPFGPFDFSPMVAYLLLWIARTFVLRLW